MNRIRSVEGVRGLAAVMVLFSHLGVMFYPAFYWGGEQHCKFIDFYVGQTPLDFLLSGNSGVMIFLLITGFGCFMACDKGKENRVKFASLRFFKLAVIMFFSTIIIWLLFQFDLVYFNELVEETQTPWFGGYNPFNKNIFILLWGNWFTISSRYNGTLWTMSYIFVSNIICIIAYELWQDLKKNYLIIAGIGIIFVIMDMPYYIPCILGYLLASLCKRNPTYRINSLTGCVLLLIAIYLCAFPTAIKSEFLIYRFLPVEYMEYYHMLGAFLLVFLSLFCNPVKKIMESRPFAILGKYSMEIYTIHFGILISFTSWLFVYSTKQFSYNKAAVLTWVFTIIFIGIIAVILKKLIDKIYRCMDKLYVKVYNYLL